MDGVQQLSSKAHNLLEYGKAVGLTLHGAPDDEEAVASAAACSWHLLQVISSFWKAVITVDLSNLSRSWRDDTKLL